MTLDLNDPNDLTLEKVKELIASSDDSVNRQVRVRADGTAFISDVVGVQEIDGLAFRLETFLAGNGYLGKAASEDEDWVKELFRGLKNNWPEPSAAYIDGF